MIILNYAGIQGYITMMFESTETEKQVQCTLKALSRNFSILINMYQLVSFHP